MVADYDVIVLGAGITGSTVARHARARGLKVYVVDPHPSQAASRAALAVIREAWHSPAERPQVRYGIDWYAFHQWRHASGARVTNWRGADRHDPDYHLVDPTAALVAPDGPCCPPDATAALTVVATGNANPGPLGVPRWGFTAVGTGLADEPLRCHFLSPYRMVAVGQVNGQVRYGSSTARDEPLARTQMRILLEQGADTGLIPNLEWGLIGAARPYPPGKHYGTVTWPTENQVVVGGMGKVGYALAPARARRVLAAKFGT